MNLTVSKSPIRIALVGLGSMGRNHFRTIQSDSRFSLVAVVDQNRESLQKYLTDQADT